MIINTLMNYSSKYDIHERVIMSGLCIRKLFVYILDRRCKEGINSGLEAMKGLNLNK
jgi:hypothetical protein